MDSPVAPLLIIVVALSFTALAARRAGRPIAADWSAVKATLVLALRAAGVFWLTFVVGFMVPELYSAVVLGDVSRDWGVGGDLFMAFAFGAALGGIGGLCHGVAVLTVPGMYGALNAWSRRIASAVTATGVLYSWYCPAGDSPATGRSCRSS